MLRAIPKLRRISVYLAKKIIEKILNNIIYDKSDTRVIILYILYRLYSVCADINIINNKPKIWMTSGRKKFRYIFEFVFSDPHTYIVLYICIV